MFCVTVYNLFPTLHFCNFEKHQFHHVLFLPSVKWHPYFEEPTSSTRPVGTVCPSKGHPTFKAMRFSMDEKSFPHRARQQTVTTMGCLFFSFYTRRAPLQGAFVKQTVDLKQCGYSPKCGYSHLCRHILDGKIITSFSAASLACCVTTEIHMGSWLKTSIVSKPSQCRMNSILSVSFTIAPVFPSLSFKHLICIYLSWSL